MVRAFTADEAVSIFERHKVLEGLVRQPDETLDEHRATIEAICSGDGNAAEAMMRRHFRRSIQRFTTESP